MSSFTVGYGPDEQNVSLWNIKIPDVRISIGDHIIGFCFFEFTWDRSVLRDIPLSRKHDLLSVNQMDAIVLWFHALQPFLFDIV